ncbi:transcription repressor ofp7 [Phtheirospermum japonicum]|uniref:Transcription repressor n=1 Tax=Phtheirospermum japonicum TaxID=374723 RepID=A0A830B9S8_9LAMI|nr:transcription repressor ofp7 [Phtheirospermum japonicum]
MAKHLKLRIYRVITATLQSCRSKDPSDLPEDPVPSFSTSLNPNDQNPRPPPPCLLRHPYPPPPLPAVCLPVNKPQEADGTRPPKLKWHVVAEIYEPPTPRRKICSSSEDDPPFALPPPPPSVADENRRRRVKKNKVKKNVPSSLRVSTSSADTGWFSSEGGDAAAAERDEEETETLVSSSLSFSTDSSTKSMRINKTRRVSKRTRRRFTRAAGVEIPARLSVFKKLIPCTVDGKVKESFAIVKRSEDPFEDFKDSMMDMILEKQMFDRKDLEQLLECFLSLNSRRYHGIIVQAFSQIWEAIFSRSGLPAGV